VSYNKCMKKYVIVFVFALIFNLSIFPSFNLVYALTEQQIIEQENQWKAELQQTEEDIAKWQGILDQTKKGTASLQNDAAVLQAKINEAKAFIKQRQIQIQQLTGQIDSKTKTITELEAKINRGKESLSAILRSTNELDSYSLAEIMLSNKNLSEFFTDVDSYNSIKTSLEDQFNQIRDLQARTDSERKVLDQKRTAEADTKAKVEADKKKVEIDEAEKQRLININKTQEKTYQQVIAEKQKKAAQIRAALFSLRDTEGIPFGDALKYSTLASQKTGVRPALILAILTQESDLGKNQGSCLLSSLDTGDGVGKNTGTFFEQIMKAPRDTVPFQAITGRLGKDWKMTPVSCPPGTIWSATRGYGGAMGPSQFIPSTWELIKNRLGSSLGINGDEVNPWNPEHAILATAMYMADLGANSSSYTSEIRAACKYYGSGGSACTYGKQVMAKAENIQLTMIDPLEGF
jgi:membrane-bound lytic murein transglycosylase B